MAKFSKARVDRCLRSFLSAASIRLECIAKECLASIKLDMLEENAGREDQLAKAIVRSSVKKLAEQVPSWEG